jgi:hypothetical protein
VIDLSIATLRREYQGGTLTPAALVEQLWPALSAEDSHHVWIERLPRARLTEYARALEGRDRATTRTARRTATRCVRPALTLESRLPRGSAAPPAEMH